MTTYSIEKRLVIPTQNRNWRKYFWLNSPMQVLTQAENVELEGVSNLEKKIYDMPVTMTRRRIEQIRYKIYCLFIFHFTLSHTS